MNNFVNHFKKCKLFLVVLICFAGINLSNAQTTQLVAWDFAGNNSTPVLATGIAGASIYARGSLQMSTALPNSFLVTNLWATSQSQALNGYNTMAAQYISFTITPSANYSIDVTNVAIQGYSQTHNRGFLLAYVDPTSGNLVTVTSISVNSPTTSLTYPVSNLTNITTPLEFRFYIYGYPTTATEYAGFGEASGPDLVIDGNTHNSATQIIPGTLSLQGNTIASTQFIGSTNNADLNIKTNNQNRVVISKDGNVGIGTTAPSVWFSAAPIMQMNGNRPTMSFTPTVAGGTATLQFRGLTGNPNAGQNSGASEFNVNFIDGNPSMLNFYSQQFSNGGNTILSLNGNGNVGIGMYAPTAKLQVNGGTYITSTDVAGHIIPLAIESNTTGKTWGIAENNTQGRLIRLVDVGQQYGSYNFYDIGINQNSSFFISKFGDSNPNNNPAFVISSGTGGNVGIGVRNPTQKLDVNGSINTLGLIMPTGAAEGKVLVTDNNGVATWRTLTVSGATISTQWLTTGSGISFPSGSVTIGNAPPSSVDFNGYLLSVNGKLIAKNVISSSNGWFDHVFEEDYNLISLEKLESYIHKNKRLPEVPSAKEVKEKGIDLAHMSGLLLQKLEEQSLYIIDLQKRIKTLERQAKK